MAALLPRLDGRGQVVWSFEVPGDSPQLVAGGARAELATATCSVGVILSILRVRGADAATMVAMIDRSFDIPPKARRSQRTIGHRQVAWFEGRGLITAIWVRDDLLCTVNGYAGEAVVLEAIDQMP